MRIVFAGRVTLPSLASYGKWDRSFPSVRWGFPLGSEIVKRLVAKGHEVVVVTEHTVAHTEKFVCDTQQGSLQVWLVPSRRRSRWTFLTLFSKEVKGIRGAIREIMPNVVFAQWTYHNAYAGLTSGFPTLIVAHDSPWRISFVERNLQAIIKAFYAQFFVFPRIRHISAVSPYIVKELRRWNRYKGEVKVVPNGVAISKEQDKGSHDLIRTQAKTVICVSDWSDRKNVKTFFSALEHLKRKLPLLRAIVYGNELSWEGASGRYLLRKGIKHGSLELRGRALWTEIDQALREEADLFVSPSLEESFGMVFVEAMRFGVPCIVGEKSGDVPWVLGAGGESRSLESKSKMGGDESKFGVEVEERGDAKNGDVGEMQGGVVCDVTDPMKLAACIERVIGDAELRRCLSDGGKRRVKEIFNIEMVVDMYEDELRRVANDD